MTRRLQNRVATSKITLLFTCLYGIIMMIAMGAIRQEWLWQTVCLALSTLLMISLNNRFSLIRIYSRLVSCSFLVLSLAATFLIPSVTGGLGQLFFIASLILLFLCYQQKNRTEIIFYAFMCIGIISLQYIVVLAYVPILLLLAFTCLQINAVRNIFASIVGVMAPYWVWLPISLWHDNGEAIYLHFTDFHLLAFPADFPDVNHLILTITIIALLGIVGTMHFLRNSYEDSIRTRMYYQTLILLFIFTLALLIALPQHEDILLRILIITASPIIAHCFVFTNSRLSNILFMLTCLGILSLTIYNAWMP